MAKEILPRAEYTVAVVGPSKNWSFDGDKGKVEMATDSIQFEGHEEYWVDVNRSAKADKPKVGEKLTGKIEQDDAGKFPPKFVKDKKGGWGGGGGKASPGAIWSSAVDVAANIVGTYAQLSGKKPKSMDEFMKRIEQVAPKVNALVDKLAGTAKPAEDTKTESESGESPAPANTPKPAAKADVEIEDIDDEELGDW